MKKKRFFASMLALVLLLSCGILPSAAFAEGAGTSQDGLVLSKTATATGNGNYKIRLEAYTTGKVITSTKTVPVDIVLVLDQSGSMAYDFDGNQEGVKYEDSRQYAMKQAMNNFIDEVNRKYTADADHRMAIVTFGSDAETLQGWTYVDTKGKNTLQGKINNDLPASPSGATNAGAGMQQAGTLMGSEYNYNGNNTKRQKVVVFFTDGVPTTGSDFDTDVANEAIAAAKTMKDSGVTVYSIGIFTGVNPDEMYGASGFNTNSDGTIGSKWIKDTWGFFPGTDFPEADRPAGNRFLNLLSSNFQNATGIGLNRKTAGLGIFHYKITYTITSNFVRSASNYYLTADNAASLNSIFQTISQNIQTADISLDSSTVVKDTISPYFTAPADTSEIKVYTAAYQGGNTWGEDTPSSLSPTVNNSSVAVTGFDFNANFITENPKEDETRGNKLVIEFTVAPKEGFLGGNNVPTNGADSGVYNKEGTVVGLFEQPTVNVPIQNVTVTAADKNVYLLNDVTAAQLQEGAEVTVGGVPLDLSKASDTTKPWGLEPWQTENVDITVTVKDKDGNVISDKLENLTEDTTYTVEVTVAPKTTGSTTAKTGTSTPAAKINLFKPELTFKDSTAYYGESVPENNNYSGNVGSETWKHGDTVSTNVTMLGTKPTLDISFTPDESKLKDGKYTKQDVPVAATVKIGTENVNDYTTFVHQDCTTACGWETPATPGAPAFLIHIQTCQLTITKEGGAADESYVFVVKKDGQPYSEVTVWGNGTETLVELPIGTYTVEEDTGWSWRFTVDNVNSETLSADCPTGRITCVNSKNKNQWLNGFSEVVRNIFGTNH